MEAMYRLELNTAFGPKRIEVCHGDLAQLDEPVDIVTVSAFQNNYVPTQRSLIGALEREKGISVSRLAEAPLLDLRGLLGIWLSRETGSPEIGRIGCIEMSAWGAARDETTVLRGIKAYFQMLDLAEVMGVPMETIAMPFLGNGAQKIGRELVLTPLLRECTAFLKRSQTAKRVLLVERGAEKAFELASALSGSYLARQERWESERRQPTMSGGAKHSVFLSYSTKDKNIADNLCAKLESAGIRVWYAPRDIVAHDYATAIVNAIQSADCFVVIISGHSLESQHVLNEIDLAFHELGRGLVLMPLKLDETELHPAFSYYLSRQHWMDAHVPPVEERLAEFVERIAAVLR